MAEREVAPPASPSRWIERDVEPVTCCLCDLPGERLFELPPFGVVRCPNCTLVFVSPRLTPEALQRLYDEPAYFDEMGYGDRGGWSPAMFLQRRWTAGRLAEIAGRRPPPGSMLEIGSGYGYFLDAARSKGYAVRGVELSRAGVAFARQRFALDITQGQLGDAADAPADVVCFWDTLEHVPDPLEFLRQARSRLAEGGLIALSVPSIASLPARLLGDRWWTLKPEQHIWHFTPATLRVLAARAGLVVTDVISSPLRAANLGRTDSVVAFGRALPDAT